jgi:hypothetical protein
MRPCALTASAVAAATSASRLSSTMAVLTVPSFASAFSAVARRAASMSHSTTLAPDFSMRSAAA